MWIWHQFKCTGRKKKKKKAAKIVKLLTHLLEIQDFWLILLTFFMQSDLLILIFGFSDRVGLPRWLSGKESICLPMQELRRCRLDPWVRKIPWRRKWQLLQYHCRVKSHGQSRLAGYSPWDHRVGNDWACMHTLWLIWWKYISVNLEVFLSVGHLK